MGFESLWFLYLFLPAGVLLHWVLPKKLKNSFLLLLSLLFFAQHSLLSLWVLVGFTAVDFALSCLMRHFDQDNRIRRGILFLSLGKSVAVLWLFLAQGGLPFGLLTCALVSAGYFLDIYRGEAFYEKRFVDFSVFCILFSNVRFGPLNRYPDFHRQLRERSFGLDQIARGYMIFVAGLAQQVLVAGDLGRLTNSLNQLIYQQRTVLAAWVLFIAGTLQLTVTLSAYCQMAVGIGLMFGFCLPVSFEKPFFSCSLQEFFGRFHKTVGALFDRCLWEDPEERDSRWYLPFAKGLLIGLTLGLWISNGWGGFWFGLAAGFGLLLEQRFSRKPGGPAGWLYCCLIMWAAFFLLFFAGSGQMLPQLRALFGQGAVVSNDDILLLLNSHWGSLAAGFLLELGLFGGLWNVFLPEKNLKNKKKTSPKSQFESLGNAVFLLLGIPVTAGLQLLVTIFLL